MLEDELLGIHDEIMEDIARFTTEEAVVADRARRLGEFRERIAEELAPEIARQLNKPHAVAYSFMLMQTASINCTPNPRGNMPRVIGGLIQAHADICFEDDEFDEQPQAPFNLADTINNTRWWLAHAEVWRKDGNPDKEIEAFRTALEFMDAFEPSADTLEMALAAPIAGGPNEFFNTNQYMTNVFHHPFRHHSTIAFELARRLEAQDPSNPEIAQLDARAMDIIDKGLAFFKEHEAWDSQAAVNLRLSQIATFAASSLDDPQRAEAIHAQLRPVYDARKQLALAPAKSLEWEMVEHAANILMYRKRGMVNEGFELGVQDAIIAMGRKLGEYFTSVPDYVGINAVYQKALGDRFPRLIAAIQEGVDQRNAPAVDPVAEPDTLKKK